MTIPTPSNLFWAVTADVTIDIESRYWRLICVRLSREEAEAVKHALDEQRDAYAQGRAVIDAELTQNMRSLSQPFETTAAWMAAAEPFHADARAKRKALFAAINMIDRRFEWDYGYAVDYSVVETSDDPRHVPATSNTEGTP